MDISICRIVVKVSYTHIGSQQTMDEGNSIFDSLQATTTQEIISPRIPHALSQGRCVQSKFPLQRAQSAVNAVLSQCHLSTPGL